MNYIISKETADGVLNYLAGQPYMQVYKLIAALQSIKELQSAPKSMGAIKMGETTGTDPLLGVSEVTDTTINH